MSLTGEKIWLDGKLVAWKDATVHVLTHTLQIPHIRQMLR